uniref:non-specific serine/threonine protein kinase n=2 Tax=Seriola lalandi dorsalis TaxID=1841481 RepID=A0A3B4YKY4_SERLL
MITDYMIFSLRPGSDLLLSDEASDTTSDLMLAQMLQMQFDREFDDQLRREEKKFNGDSKVSISFENYRMVHPYEDSDSSEDEVDWQDTRHDPYRAEKPQTTPRKGFTGKGKNITTKHDEVMCGRKNTARMDNFAPEVHVGDGLGMDLKLSNQVFNSLKQHCYSEQRRSSRLHEKKEHSTAVMKKAEIPCPEVVMLKKHILVMSFIGKDHVPAPKLKDARLGSEDMKNAYYQVLHMMQQLFQECNLVHADLSEYNMLWHEGKVWLIDVSQSVEPTHPHGLEFLFRDCRNVSTFFQKRGVSEAMSVYDLFNAVTGLNIPVGAEEEAEFFAEVTETPAQLL